MCIRDRKMAGGWYRVVNEDGGTKTGDGLHEMAIMRLDRKLDDKGIDRLLGDLASNATPEVSLVALGGMGALSAGFDGYLYLDLQPGHYLAVDFMPDPGSPRPHLLDGYIDAGSITHGTGRYLLEVCEHEVLVEFDHDQVHDYRSRRPRMVFDTDHWVGMTDYALVIHKLKDAVGKPFLMLSGPEPDTQWNRTASAVLGIAEQLGVSRLLLILQLVPHAVGKLLDQRLQIGPPADRPVQLDPAGNGLE